MKNTAWTKIAAAFLLIMVLQIIIGGTVFFSHETWETRGAFGDMFGVVNTLFSGMAFAGVIIAIFLQREELELQRNELELTRKELKN